MKGNGREGKGKEGNGREGREWKGMEGRGGKLCDKPKEHLHTRVGKKGY